MLVACSDNRSAACNGLNRYRAVSGGVVTQLAIAVVAPARDTTCGKKSTGMSAPNRNSYSICDALDGYGDVTISEGVVTQLAISVFAPTLDGSIHKQSTGLVASG